MKRKLSYINDEGQIVEEEFYVPDEDDIGFTNKLLAENEILKKKLDEKSDSESRALGEWVPSNPETDTLECSKCGYNIISEEWKTPYCPWCGTKMKDWACGFFPESQVIDTPERQP